MVELCLKWLRLRSTKQQKIVKKEMYTTWAYTERDPGWVVFLVGSGHPQLTSFFQYVAHKASLRLGAPTSIKVMGACFNLSILQPPYNLWFINWNTFYIYLWKFLKTCYNWSFKVQIIASFTSDKRKVKPTLLHEKIY